VKSFLDDPPTLVHSEKCKEVRHADAGTGQIARPVCDLKPNHSNRFSYFYANDAGLNVRSWSVSVDPVEQESESIRELIASITKERSLRVKGGTHQFAVALLATVNVQLKSFQNRVMFRLGFRGGHAPTVRPSGPINGQIWPKRALPSARMVGNSKLGQSRPWTVRFLDGSRESRQLDEKMAISRIFPDSLFTAKRAGSGYFRGSKRTSTSVSTLAGWPPLRVGR
jgi:hypothetical protein